MRTVLFVTHAEEQCGVFQFGNDIFQAITSSEKYNFIRVTPRSLKDLNSAIAMNRPVAVIYNFHPRVMPWLYSKVAPGYWRSSVPDVDCPQIGMIHEITREIADTAVPYRLSSRIGNTTNIWNSFFDYYIAADPTLLLQNPIVFKTGRLVPAFDELSTVPGNVPIIGSFGFGTPNKGFEDIVDRVQQEFDTALIRFNLPFAEFGDKDGTNAKAIVASCQEILKKPGIRLKIDHTFLGKSELMRFLAGNDVNVFMYKDKDGRGISSAIDNAMAVKKPIAVTECPMFRHILGASPSVSLNKNSLKTILSNEFTPLQRLADEWNAENMRWDYERILDRILDKKPVGNRQLSLLQQLKKNFSKKIRFPSSVSANWLRDTESATKDNLTPDSELKFEPVALPEKYHFNRILNDEARAIYAPVINFLKKAVPLTMAKKIERANVQQAFVLDTVFRFSKSFNNPKILAAGSYEDTASMGLQKLNMSIHETDPVLNYTLQEFYSKPSTEKSSYDIIFSTSVIEHVEDDQSFLTCIVGLLKPGGIGVVTMDYKDGWQFGDLKPEVDFRFYTKHDLESRLLSYAPEIELVDEGRWDCPDPDFLYMNKYRYTFATFVFRKK